MELALVKNELSPRSHRLLMLETDSVVTTKCVKRRRRDSSIAQQGDVSEIQQPLSGQATTVKRSSKFRGVSRHVLIFLNILFCFYFFISIVSSVAPTHMIKGVNGV
jgi:hypothetical protein